MLEPADKLSFHPCARTQMADMRDQYRQAVQQLATARLREDCPDYVFDSRVPDWPSGPATRFYADRWGGVNANNATIYHGYEEGDSFFELLLHVSDSLVPQGATPGAFGPRMLSRTENSRAWHI